MTILTFIAENGAPKLGAIIKEANKHPLVDQGGMRCNLIGENVVLEIITDQIFTAERVRELLNGQFSQFGFVERVA